MQNINISHADFTKSAYSKRVNPLLKRGDISSRNLFTQTVRTVANGIGGMEPGAKYAMQDFFEAPTWESTRRGVRIAHGLCLSYLVANELVPLRYASKPYDTNKRYELAPDADPESISIKVD